MWSIIDLPVLNDGLDEKEENLHLLVDLLQSIHRHDLANQLMVMNRQSRSNIRAVFPKLRSCSIQGDLNPSNILLDSNQSFVGLIDFNMAGAEVNINNILNETRLELKVEHFENYSSEEIYQHMTAYRSQHLRCMSQYYILDRIERQVWQDYRRIIDSCLWPNVVLWKSLIDEGI